MEALVVYLVLMGILLVIGGLVSSHKHREELELREKNPELYLRLKEMEQEQKRIEHEQKRMKHDSINKGIGIGTFIASRFLR